MTEPIDMILHCPACGLQHIDKPEGQFIPGFTADETQHYNELHGLWTNPPHRSHLCHGCGHIWRPADVPTNGVAAIKTKGKADSPVRHPVQQSDMREAELVSLLKGIEHCSDVFATFRPDLHTRLKDFKRSLRAQVPRDDFPDDYEV